MSNPSPQTEIRSRQQLLRELGGAVRANQRATDSIDEAAARVLGVNRTDAKFLDLLDEHGRMSAGELSQKSGLTTGAVTAAIDRLERAGYVQRAADPGDRRRVLVALTPLARKASSEMFGPLAEAVGPLLARYSDDQLAMLIEFHQLGRELQERLAAKLRERLQDSALR